MNARQERLIEVLHARDYVLPETIFEEVPEYSEFDGKGFQSARKKRLSYDVREINNNADVPFIICSTRRGGYKIGTKEEASRYIRSRRVQAIKMLQSSINIEKKLANNNQMTFTNEDIEQIVAVLEGETNDK